MPTANTLVVYSDPLRGESIRAALQLLGCRSVLAADEVEGVQRLWTDGPEGIVIDLADNSIDAERILRRARTCPETRNAVVLGLVRDTGDVEMWHEWGCQVVLPRGATPRQIAAALIARMGTDERALSMSP